jgi:hypothetical protein
LLIDLFKGMMIVRYDDNNNQEDNNEDEDDDDIKFLIEEEDGNNNDEEKKEDLCRKRTFSCLGGDVVVEKDDDYFWRRKSSRGSDPEKERSSLDDDEQQRPQQQQPSSLVDLFDGAVYVATQQLEKTVSSGHCAVCRRPIENDNVMECATDTFLSSLASLRTRRALLLGGRKATNFYHTTIEEQSNSSLVARKLGYQTYLRQIKHDSLRCKECVVCQRGFDGSQGISPLLSNIDRLLDSCNSRNAADPSW